MQIINRLNKLETLERDSTVCACPETPKFEFITQKEGESIEIPVDHLCGNCGKPVGGTVIIIQSVKPEKPDWMTDEQFAAAYAE
jgi:hypothetical protein